jgi:hypothetical protein
VTVLAVILSDSLPSSMMRTARTLLFLAACGGVRNAPPASPSSPVATPIAAFLSGLHTTKSLGVDETTTTFTLRMTSGRVAFAVFKDVTSGGQMTHPMQALILPEDAIDVAELGGVLCTLKRDATVTCAALRSQVRGAEQFTVDADARRLLLLSDEKRCVLRETGNWRCYTRQFDHPWTASEYASQELDKHGLGLEPVPGARCFITREAKLVCFDEEVIYARDQVPDVVSASVGLGRADFSGGCAAHKDGSVSCWTHGINEMGVLGNGQRGPASGPQRVVGVSDAVAVSFEPEHACALTRTDDVWCWGSADGYAFGEAAYDAAKRYKICAEGQSPGGNDCITSSPFDRSPHQRVVLIPRVVPELHGVTSIAVGHERTCGVRTDGRILCLGGGYPGPWTASL